MKAKIAIVLAFIGLILLAVAFSAASPGGNTYFNIPIRKLLAEPSPEAEVVYDVPIDVKMLGISEDKNWYKVRIRFDLVFLGHYEFTGWVYAPKLKDVILGKIPSQESVRQ